MTSCLALRRRSLRDPLGLFVSFGVRWPHGLERRLSLLFRSRGFRPDKVIFGTRGLTKDVGGREGSALLWQPGTPQYPIPRRVTWRSRFPRWLFEVAHTCKTVCSFNRIVVCVMQRNSELSSAVVELGSSLHLSIVTSVVVCCPRGVPDRRVSVDIPFPSSFYFIDKPQASRTTQKISQSSS